MPEANFEIPLYRCTFVALNGAQYVCDLVQRTAMAHSFFGDGSALTDEEADQRAHTEASEAFGGGLVDVVYGRYVDGEFAVTRYVKPPTTASRRSSI